MNGNVSRRIFVGSLAGAGVGAVGATSLLDFSVSAQPVSRDPLTREIRHQLKEALGKMRDGQVFYPEERISREQALRMYTVGAAWMQFAEKDRGSIEVGKLADLVVIDRDFLTCPEDEIRSIEPVMTVVGGRVVYQRK